MLSPLLLITILGPAGVPAWCCIPAPGACSSPAVVQGVCGAALALEVSTRTGPLVDGIGELTTVAFVGAWTSLGVAHATAAVLRRLRSATA